MVLRVFGLIFACFLGTNAQAGPGFVFFNSDSASAVHLQRVVSALKTSGVKDYVVFRQKHISMFPSRCDKGRSLVEYYIIWQQTFQVRVIKCTECGIGQALPLKNANLYFRLTDRSLEIAEEGIKPFEVVEKDSLFGEKRSMVWIDHTTMCDVSWVADSVLFSKHFTTFDLDSSSGNMRNANYEFNKELFTIKWFREMLVFIREMEGIKAFRCRKNPRKIQL